MGFSISGSFVIILLSVFVAAGAVLTSGGNTVERLAETRDSQADRVELVHDTAVDIRSVTLSGPNDDCTVSVTVNNTGSATLALEDTSLMIDNSYQTGWQDGATVNGDASTDLWLSDERLSVERTGLPTPPDGITVVTGTGIADRVDTEDRTCS